MLAAEAQAADPEVMAAAPKLAIKHRLVLLAHRPEGEVHEVDRRARALARELRAEGQSGLTLARQAAEMSVRMERCAEVERAMVARSVRRAIVAFVPPEGASEEEADELCYEAGRIAQFVDTAPAEAVRRHEREAVRGFHRALDELRRRDRESKPRRSVATAEPKARPQAEPSSPAAPGSFRRNEEGGSGSFRQNEADEPDPVTAPSDPAPVAPRFESKWGDVSDPEARKKRPDPAKLRKNRR